MDASSASTTRSTDDFPATDESVTTSHGVLAPSAFSVRGIHQARVCLARYGPHPRFLTSFAGSSSSNLSAVFHTDPLLGFAPSELDHPAAESPSRRFLPPLPFSGEPLRLRRFSLDWAAGRIDKQPARALLGLCPLKLSPARSRLERHPLMALASAGLQGVNNPRDWLAQQHAAAGCQLLWALSTFSAGSS